MLCTRWFLPLLILPVPSAQPYFLVLFLVSLVLHARPCFYCISLLTALFMSSCYWQPISMTSSLATPWSENISTFSDAWDVTLTNITMAKPAIMRLTDRCWVDWSFGGLFNPSNVAEWERISIVKLKSEAMKEDEKQRNNAENNTTSVTSSAPDASPGQDESSGRARTDADAVSLSSWNHTSTTPQAKIGAILRDVFASAWRRRSPEANSSSAPPLSSSDPSTFLSNSPDGSLPVSRMPQNLPWLRREYDMQLYGFDIIFDFSWSR